MCVINMLTLAVHYRPKIYWIRTSLSISFCFPSRQASFSYRVPRPTRWASLSASVGSAYCRRHSKAAATTQTCTATMWCCTTITLRPRCLSGARAFCRSCLCMHTPVCFHTRIPSNPALLFTSRSGNQILRDLKRAQQASSCRLLRINSIALVDPSAAAVLGAAPPPQVRHLSVESPVSFLNLFFSSD